MSKKEKIKEVIYGISGAIIGFVSIVWGSAAIETFIINPSLLQFTLCLIILFADWQGFRIMTKSIFRLVLNETLAEIENHLDKMSNFINETNKNKDFE